MKKIVLVTGGFDPPHSGHIEYLRAAKVLGDRLVVGLNSDAWLTRKKSRPFMNINERESVIGAIKGVDQVLTGFDDSDDTSCDAIRTLRMFNPDAEIIFANGGDRAAGNTPEQMLAAELGNITFRYGVGGTSKANSSSWILQEWKTPKTLRTWGYYRVLHQDGREVKVKELTVEPGQKLSLQKHEKRAEFWFVTTGQATVYTLDSSSDVELMGVFGRHQHLWLPRLQWHQLANEGTEPLRIVEIQYGEDCIEDDITRR